MGHIRVRDLAKKMGLEEQDLLFKLRSIGVRVDGADSEVDPSTLAAVLQGKRVASPREVIIRDAKAKPVTHVPKKAPAPVQKPMKKRRRSMIQKVEPHIRNLQVAEKVKVTPPVKPTAPTPPEVPKVETKVKTEPQVTAKPVVPAESQKVIKTQKGFEDFRSSEARTQKSSGSTTFPDQPERRNPLPELA